jgi:hypothetical protein
MTIWTVVICLLVLGAVGVVSTYEYRSGHILAALLLVAGAIISLSVLGYTAAILSSPLVSR